jgi:hypothetical protein
LVLASTVILRSEFRWTHNHILLFQIRNSPNLEGQIPVFISPRNRVVQLYPQALGSLFVASYDSQGYGGGIRPLLHTGGRTHARFTTAIYIPETRLCREKIIGKYAIKIVIKHAHSWK